MTMRQQINCMFVFALLVDILSCAGAVASTLETIDKSERSGADHDRATILEAANIPQIEMQALQDLYTSTDGENWLWITPYNDANGYPWNFSATANPCTDLWQGITCTSYSQQYYVTTISLVRKHMVGTLPDSLGQFTQLRELVLQERLIHGTIPYTIGDLSELTVLHIEPSSLTGPIPASLGQLYHLDSLIISYSSISGTIPQSLSQLANMTNIEFLANRLSGTIPNIFNDMQYLLDIVLSGNFLNGSVPSLADSNAHLLQTFTLYSNQLTGTLPVELTRFRSLRYVDFDSNFLTGSIPEQYGDLCPLMILIDLSYNVLTGTVPAGLGNLYDVQTLVVSNNYLHGTIPSSLCALTMLQFFAVDRNVLTGAILPCIGTLSQLEFVYLYSNKLTGSIPASVGNLSSLLYVDFSDNQLSGSIPAELGQATTLQHLALEVNRLTGSIPRSIGNLSALQVLRLHYNDLSGSLSGVFDPANQQALTTIQLNNNPFTGTLPPELFQLIRLTSIALVANCLTGTLPAQTLCQHNRLENIMLDGLSSADNCRHKLLPGLTTSYAITQQVGGTIPPCIFALPNLSSLHLSGNGFTGNLPESLVLGPHLLNLTLSHNTLTGSVPRAIQERKWVALDLSYNRLSGSLSDNFASIHVNRTHHVLLEKVLHLLGYNLSEPVPSVALENNRLSGRIPGVLHSFTSLSVLGSNLFSCKVDKSDLPSQDSSVDTYECGSNAFDVNYYVWLGLLVPAIVSAVYLLRVDHSALRYVSQPHKLGAFGQRLEALREVSQGCTVYILIALLPLYCSLGKAYHTFTHQYAWQISSAFLSGAVPCALMFVFLAGLLCVILALFRRGLTGEFKNTVIQAQDTWVHRPQQHTIAIYSTFIAVNVVAVLGVNIAYVYIAIYESSDLKTFAQVMLSIFKIAWNGVVAPRLLQRLAVYWTNSAEYSYSESEFTLLQLSLALFNNIGIPFLVVACISPSCFYNVFVDAPQVQSYFQYTQCKLIDDNTGDCLVQLPASASVYYNPPFTYSYQCSSSLITYYAPAFVNTCIITTFLTPVSQFVLHALHKHMKGGTKLHDVLSHFVPLLVRPYPVDLTAKQVSKLNITHANRELIALITNVALLVTFGAVFPPLAAALAVTVLACVYFVRFKVMRYLALAQEEHHEPFAERVRQECAEVSVVPLLANTMWLLVTIAALFSTLFLFDTLGDAVGAQGAIWVLIVMPLLPLCMYGTLRMYEYTIEANDLNKVTSVTAITADPEAALGGTRTQKGTIEAKDAVQQALQMEMVAIPSLHQHRDASRVVEAEQVNVLWAQQQSSAASGQDER